MTARVECERCDFDTCCRLDLDDIKRLHMKEGVLGDLARYLAKGGT